MTDLTGRQKRYLRSLGQSLPATCTVGKAGLSEGVISNISGLLDNSELVKVRLAGSSGDDRQVVAVELADAVRAACVGVLGKTVLLYRPSELVAHDRRIVLP